MESWSGVRAGVIVGNPKAKSRTYQAALLVARRLLAADPELVVDIAGLGAGVLEPGDPVTSSAVDTARGLDLLVVASPTYKATYTGLLKVFLDRFPSGGLAGVVAVPLMLGAGQGHALAPELHLKPVLAELGASTPTRALYLPDSSYDDPAILDPWLDAWRGTVLAAVAARARAHT